MQIILKLILRVILLHKLHLCINKNRGKIQNSNKRFINKKYILRYILKTLYNVY